MPDKAETLDQLPPEARSCRLNKRHRFPDEQNLPYEIYRDGLGGVAMRKSAYCGRGCKTKRVWEFVEHIRDGYEVVDRVPKTGGLDYSETNFYLLAKGNPPVDVGRLRYLETKGQLPKPEAPKPAPKKAKPRKATADPFAVEVETVRPTRKRTARKATRAR